MEIAIQQLDAEWASEYRVIRHRALRDRPESYFNTYEQEKDWPVSYYAQLLASSYTLGAVADNALVATAVLKPFPAWSAKHRCEVVAVYVAPECRGQQLARRLMLQLIDYASAHPDYLQIHLSVESTNHNAIELYKALGFEIYGTEPRAARHGDQFYDEHWMVKSLD